jgi:hypothetical protein
MVVLLVVDIVGRISCNDNISMYGSRSNSRSSIIMVVLIVISRSGYSSSCSKGCVEK